MSLDRLHLKLQRMWREERDPHVRKCIESLGKTVKRKLDEENKEDTFKEDVIKALT